MSARVGAGFWFVAAAFAIVMAFGTVPSPLWPLYGLSSTLVTVAFAAMVIGVGTGLYFMGHLSDRFGRRRIVLPALVIALAAAATMAAWHQLPGLLIGRVLTGVAAGLMASTATTYLTELRPASPRLSSGVAAAANLGGLSLGPLVAGALAQWAAHPLVTPYVVFAVLMALGLLGVALTPETVERGRAGRDARFQLRAGRGGAFAGAAAVAFCSFAIFGLFASLGSVIVRGELHNTSRWTWGLAAFVVLGVSPVAQVAFSRLSVSRLLAIGLAGAPVGFVLVVIALYHPSLALYLDRLGGRRSRRRAAVQGRHRHRDRRGRPDRARGRAVGLLRDRVRGDGPAAGAAGRRDPLHEPAGRDDRLRLRDRGDLRRRRRDPDLRRSRSPSPPR